jgi:hypothetical protein
MRTFDKVLNYTPHVVRICNIDQMVEIPSSGVARVSVKLSRCGMANGIPLVQGEYGEVTGLPAEESSCGFCGAVNCDGTNNGGICSPLGEHSVFPTLYIVSAMVRAALPQRKDLANPAELIRDDKGGIIGCQSLEMNPD